MNTATVNKEHTTKKMSTRQMTFIALMTAVTCILGPLSIPLPFSPVPISFTNLAIYLSLYVLGLNGATISYLVYLLIGMVGVPVFSGFSGGFGKLAGSDWRIFDWIYFLTLIAGLLMKLFPGNKVMEAVGLVLGTVVCYAFGTAWLCFQAHMSAAAGLAAGVIPYIPGDLVKIVVAMIVGTALRAAIKKSKIMCRTKNKDRRFLFLFFLLLSIRIKMKGVRG